MSSDVPRPPSIGTMGMDALAARGQAYAAAHHVVAALRISYGREVLADGSSFWGEPSYVAIIGHVGPGGPRVLAAACPIMGGSQQPWRPVLELPDEQLVYGGRTLSLFDMVALVSTGGLLVQPAVELLPPDERFYEWLGFLVQLQEHRFEEV